MLSATVLAESFAPEKGRKWLGFILLGGGVFGAFWLWKNAAAPPFDPKIYRALIAGLIAAAATAAGALPVLITREVSSKFRDAFLGFGAGIMLAAVAFSLVIPALAAAQATGASPWASGLAVAAALLLGAALLLLLERYIPQHHFLARASGSAPQAIALRRAWLFVFAVSLHNLPEGLAIGAGFGGSSEAGATALATGIAIQDLPEGLVIALALVAAGYDRRFAVVMGALSGVIEPIAAVFGAVVISSSVFLLPWGLAFAAGAMLYVISHEIIPQAHEHGHGRWATSALMLGFCVMTLLDTLL